MATAGFPALAIHTEGESPLNTLGKIEQIKAAQQSQEMGSIQLQEARLKQQSQQAIMGAWAASNGDLDKTFAAVAQSGKVLPDDLINLQTHIVDLKTKAATLSDKDLEVQAKQNTVLYNSLQSYQALPPEQRTPDKLQGIMANLASQNIPIDRFVPTFKALAQNSSDAVLKPIEYGLVGQKKVLDDEAALRIENSAPTIEQAKAKIAAELSTAQSNALKAQREFDNMPSPIEAKTARQAQLLVEQSTAAKNFAEAEKTKAETILAKMEPVEGINPTTGMREVTGRQDAAKKKFEQVTPLNADQYNKEAMLSTRFGQVAQNYGKYEAAIRQAGPVTHVDDMAQVIADQALGNNPGLLHVVPSGGLVTTKEVSKATADSWNHLTPDERKLAQAYLQVKGGIITYNKAVDDTGRANETALSLEAANIPTPLEDKHVALERIKGNKDNIRAIIPAIPRFEHLEDPNEYLKAGENVPITGAPVKKPFINLGLPDLGLSRAADRLTGK